MYMARKGVASIGGSGASHRCRFLFGYWAAAFTYVMLQAFTTLPSPLYNLYAARDHLSPLTITLVYAAYAVGVALSLVLAGHLSDMFGRRPILLAALMINVLAALVFILWPSLPGLFAARVVSGVAVGMSASTATAYLHELFAAHHPPHHTHRAGVLAAAASVGGLGVGGLISGLIAETSQDSLSTPYMVMICLFALCVVVILVAPETRGQPDIRERYRPQRIAVPLYARGQYFASLTGAASVFALFGLFVGLAGTFLSQVWHHHSLWLSGTVLFVLFATGAITILATGHLLSRTLVRMGGSLMLGGLVILVMSAWLPDPNLFLFVVAGAVIGAGGSILFRASLAIAAGLAPAGRGAETLAGFFLAGYLGLSVPVVGIGIALEFFSPRATLLGFSVIVAVTVIIAVLGLVRAHRLSQAVTAPDGAQQVQSS